MQAVPHSNPPDTKNGTDRDPESPQELVDTVVRRGDLAVELYGDRWYYVLARAPEPAGEFHFGETAGTLTDWEDCDDNADVLIVVNLDDAEQTVGVDDLDDICSAIAHNRLFRRARPAPKLVPALDEFADAAARGEWNGLVDYVEGVR